MSGAFSVVRGDRIRVTKVNSCGLPIEGPGHRLVTDGFISIKYSRVDNEAEELTQKNANGKICVQDRTPPQRKWYNVEAQMCGVDPDLVTLATGFPVILDHNNMPVGFGDQTDVDTDYGTVLELWTGGKSEDDCAVPTTDSIFTRLSSGKSYGYFIIAVKEWNLGDIEVANQVTNLTMTGISLDMSNWGRGPYNVAAIDDDGTPGRLLVPMPEDRHLTLFRTSVAPPPVTDGGVALDITGKFVDPDFYFGGDDDEPSADIAPEQDTTTKTLTFTGTGSAGGFEVTVDGETTTTIVYNPTASNIQDAINALPSIYGAVVTGSSGGPFTVKLVGLNVSVSVTSHITGGTVAVS